jgi:hypothetical protein
LLVEGWIAARCCFLLACVLGLGHAHSWLSFWHREHVGLVSQHLHGVGPYQPGEDLSQGRAYLLWYFLQVKQPVRERFLGPASVMALDEEARH